jgi:hypothetical protein
MKALLKLAAYTLVCAVVADIVALFAWGASFGMTGSPSFYSNDTVAGVGAVFAVVGSLAAGALFENRPWE